VSYKKTANKLKYLTINTKTVYNVNIKNELINNEVYKKVKDYSKNRNDLKTYYNVGKLLSEAGKRYGEGIVKKYSEKLTKELGKIYSERTLRKFRQFYVKFSDVKWSTLWTVLQWSHYKELMSLKDDNEIKYYINLSLEQNLSVRELRQRIKNKEYERLDDKTKIKLTNKEKTKSEDFIKNPILIKSKYNKENISEKMLQKLILEDIPSFLKELGKNLSFIDNEYPIKIFIIYSFNKINGNKKYTRNNAKGYR